MAKGGRVRLVVIRSGRTAWDEDGRFQGHADLPLSPGGVEDLGAMAKSLDVHFGSVFCATDESSVESAKLIAKAAGGRVRQTAGLAEPDLGLWEGKKAAGLAEQNPKTMRQWREDPTAVCPPNGEAIAEARLRIIDSAAKILDRPLRKAVAIVVRPLAFGVLRSVIDELTPETITAPHNDDNQANVLDRMVSSAMLRSRRELPRRELAKVDG
ncbi:MAG: histidine phosphatase family protein [Phycisphaerales bacterium]|nr:histidine phosphatase family protein [Phycisphaerales bacterium]